MRSDWHNAIIYQIYPRSFYDSNGDGIGDLRGIIKKIDYLVDLNIDAVWLSPFYKSPMVDFGYDVSDFLAIDPIYGTMQDFEELVSTLHAHNIKLIMDYIPNHTSDRHEWFKQSCSSKNNAKRDWYIWRDAKPDGSPPNNWLSNFGGSAWKWDEHTKQYYYHTFFKEQPDLNWRNPEVYNAMIDVFTFWLSKKVDGFRIDAVSFIYKDLRFLDEPAARIPDPHFPYYDLDHIYTLSQPELFKFVSSIQASLNESKDVVFITETTKFSLDDLIRFHHSANHLHSPFNFFFITLQWNAKIYREFIDLYERSINEEYVKNYVIGNHDQPRVATRVGRDQARIAAMLQLMLPGMPTIYYGEEIGMESVAIPLEKVHDPMETIVPGKGLGRDPERTPMQWTAAQNAGFSEADPWLPIGNYSQNNVQNESADELSFLSLYNSLITLRKTSPALLTNSYRSLNVDNDSIFCFERASEHENLLIVLNFSGMNHSVIIPKGEYSVVFNTHMSRRDERVVDTVEIGHNEGLILRRNVIR